MGTYITERQRYEIELLLKEKYSVSRIAQTLGIKYNTLYKEIRRGMVEQMDTLLRVHKVYKADYAQMAYRRSVSNRGRLLKIGHDHRLAAYIEEMVGEGKYSPAALLAHAENVGLRFSVTLSVSTIYNYFSMGLFLNVGPSDLPLGRMKKRREKEEKRGVSLNNRRGRVIDGRPPDASDRGRYGHWEMDTVVGAKGSGPSRLLVLSERMTREEVIVKLPDGKGISVARALDSMERRMGSPAFREKFKSITCDNGVEFLDSAAIEKSCRSKIPRTALYYCHPYSSWERGTNENINRMVRRFFPKGTDFGSVPPDRIRKVQEWINNYPRGIFGGLSSRLYREKLGIAL